MATKKCREPLKNKDFKFLKRGRCGSAMPSSGMRYAADRP